MTNRAAETSPQIYAELCGVLYLITIVLGAAEQVAIRGKIVVSGDAAATAANLRAMESSRRWGIAAELVVGICTIILTWALYILLRPVNKNLALLAAVFSLVASAVETAYALHLVEALYPLGNAAYLGAFTPEQLNAMTSMAIKAQGSGFGIALLLFGCFFPIAAYLIFQSGYFPKALGILYLIPGLSYLASSLLLIVAPAFADRYYFAIAGPALIGELSLALWLLLKGVNEEKWEARVLVFGA